MIAMKRYNICYFFSNMVLFFCRCGHSRECAPASMCVIRNISTICGAQSRQSNSFPGNVTGIRNTGSTVKGV
jgi:hypothetical protein